MNTRELQIKAVQLRKRLLQLIYNAGAGHTGGDLSCMEILVTLYNAILRIDPANPRDPTRDRYVQSKGHAVEALYVVLADRGFFPATELETLCRYKSRFIGHPTRKVPGIEMNTGALGHGLSISVGMALAGKMDGATWRVFTLLGDGELAEGSNWEAAMAAAHYKLDNLVAIVDYNGLQITGPVREVMCSEPLADKFSAFGWCVKTVDGHDVAALIDALRNVPFKQGKPSVLLARTVKGKGVSFMENDPKWHHGVPSHDELDRALRELDTLEAKLHLTT